MRWTKCYSLALLLCLANPRVAHPERSDPTTTCPTGTIASITIDNHSIFDTSDPDLSSQLRLAYRLANSLHARTRSSVIRRDLLLQVGDCFDTSLISESERLLRDNQFLASATITHTERADGLYDLKVTTRDEWSTRLDIRASLNDGPIFKGASLRESNFLGTGQTIELFYLDHKANRDYGIGYHNHQLGGSRWHLGAGLGRNQIGSLITQSLALPFREESGRWAFRQEFRRLDRYFDYLIDDDGSEEHLLVPTSTTSTDLALIRRIGPPGGRQLTLGGAVSYTRITFPDNAGGLRVVEGNDFHSAEEAGPEYFSPVQPQLSTVDVLRSLVLVGQRKIVWSKDSGFDTLRGEQDIRLGTEFGIAFGPSLRRRAGADHLYAAIDLYGAARPSDLLLVGRVRGDGERALEGDYPGWNNLWTEVEGLAYWKPGSGGRQTFVLRAAATGGWHTTTPFQIVLGGDLGVRGYPERRFPGGRRVIFSLEDRILLDGPLRNVMDLGLTTFFDLGRTWSGDVPFGTDSGWRAAAGIGLRNAFPSGGRRTYRIDLALPVRPHTTWRDLRLILSVGELIGISPNLRRQRLEELQRFTSRDQFHFPD